MKRFVSNFIGPDLLKESVKFNGKSSVARLKIESKLKLKGENVLFGVHPVAAALFAQKRKIYRLYLAEDSQIETLSNLEKTAAEKNIEIRTVKKQCLDQVVDKSVWNPHQGAILDCDRLPVSCLTKESDFIIPEENFVPILVNIMDPMNLGAIMRSANFFGCKSLLLTTDCSKLSPVVSKASSGAMELLNLYTISSKLLPKYISWLRNPENHAIVVATAGSATNDSAVLPLDKFSSTLRNASSRLFALFGNEGRGLSDDVARLSNYQVVIPSHSNESSMPLINSLNVSVATGIFLHKFAARK